MLSTLSCARSAREEAGDGRDLKGGRATDERAPGGAGMTADERKGELFPADTKGKWVDAVAVGAELIPVLGGAVSNVLNGWSQERRMQRVKDVIEDLSARVKGLGTRVDEAYVRSDEFEDLLDRTLRQVAAERHQNKRRLYAAFLAGAIECRGEPYDEQLRMLRTIEELQPDHVRVLKAILEEPSLRSAGAIGDRNITKTLQERLPDIPAQRLEDLVAQLADDLRLTIIGGRIGLTITTHPETGKAPDRFTDYGHRLIRYILAAGVTA